MELALLAAVLGLYGLMAYAVTRRTRELGVRIALGATPARVTRLVLRSGLTLAAAGVAAGLAIAAYAGAWLQPYLFETSPRGAAVLAGVAAILLATAAAAGWLPARRAARISPTDALRAE